MLKASVDQCKKSQIHFGLVHLYSKLRHNLNGYKYVYSFFFSFGDKIVKLPSSIYITMSIIKYQCIRHELENIVLVVLEITLSVI